MSYEEYFEHTFRILNKIDDITDPLKKEEATEALRNVRLLFERRYLQANEIRSHLDTIARCLQIVPIMIHGFVAF